MNKILKYSFIDLIRSNWVISYTAFYFVATFGLLVANGDISKAIISLLHVITILIPLISTVFGVIYFYNSRDYIEMLLAQPIRRSTIFLGQFLGLVLSLCFSFVVGILIPFLVYGVSVSGYLLHFLYVLVAGILMTIIFSALAYLIALLNDNRLRGFGLAILTWLLFAILYDGIFVLAMIKFEEYPLDKVSLIASLFNPIDLSRIFIMLKFDTAALFGYTGALFHQFFGSNLGVVLAGFALLVWCFVPVLIILAKSNQKDF